MKCEIIYYPHGKPVQCSELAQWTVRKRAMGPYPAHSYKACDTHAKMSVVLLPA